MNNIHAIGFGVSGQPLTWQNLGSVECPSPLASENFHNAIGVEGLSAFERGLALGFHARRQALDLGTALDINSRVANSNSESKL
jgi:hypothetical protein